MPYTKKRETHGMCKSRAYKSWESMRNRCSNKNNRAYKNYGGRGISVCSRWESFALFVEDMGEPEEDQTIERIDTNKGYNSGNCRWATRSEQSRNTRRNRYITACGKTQLLCDWASELGVSHCTILRRIKAGWTETESVTIPKVRIRRGIPRGKIIKDHQQHGGCQ